MHDEEDYRYSKDFLQHIIDEGHLEGAALGITRQVIAKGHESLTEKQKNIFQKHVLDNFTVLYCKRCGKEIPWTEIYDAAATQQGICSWCLDVILKED